MPAAAQGSCSVRCRSNVAPPRYRRVRTDTARTAAVAAAPHRGQPRERCRPPSTCRVRRGPLRNAVLRGVLVLQEDGGCEVVLEDGNTPSTARGRCCGRKHEILDRLWDEVRFDAVLADGVPYVAHARLYARWPPVIH